MVQEDTLSMGASNVANAEEVPMYAAIRQGKAKAIMHLLTLTD